MRTYWNRSIALFTEREAFLNLLVCMVWGMMLFDYLRGIVNHLPVVNNFTDQIEIGCVLLPLCLAMPTLLTKFTLLDYGIFFFWVILFVCDYALHPDNTLAQNEFALQCLCVAYPAYFIGRIIDIRKFYHAFFLISTVCILMSLYYFFHYIQTAKSIADIESNENMYAAYCALPHVTLMLWAALRHFNIVAMLLTLAGVVFLLSCGTRGPLLCLGVFGMCYFLGFMNFKHAYVVKGILLGVATLALCFLKEIMVGLVLLFTRLHLSTRVIEKFLSGEIGNDTGRESVRRALLNYMDTYGDFFGLGYFGSTRFGYAYPHHFYVDFCITYGYVIGTALFAVCLLLLGSSLLKARTTEARVFLCLLTSITVVKYFMSNTFVSDPFFFMLLGYCMRVQLNTNTVDHGCINK